MGLSSCGPWGSFAPRIGDLPGPGIESVSLALARGFSMAGPPGKSRGLVLRELVSYGCFVEIKGLLNYLLVGW